MMTTLKKEAQHSVFICRASGDGRSELESSRGVRKISDSLGGLPRPSPNNSRCPATQKEARNRAACEHLLSAMQEVLGEVS
jgi:hypothetical protein